MKSNILWIEDSAFVDLRRLAGPVCANSEFNLDVCLNAADAMDTLMKKKYSAVIVDIRIPPGNNQHWIDYFNERGSNIKAARLGIQLLYAFLDTPDPKLHLGNLPKQDWIMGDRFGIYTVESYNELVIDLINLKIRVFHQKMTPTPRRMLLDIISELKTNLGNRWEVK
jgi:hypothetical protein